MLPLVGANVCFLSFLPIKNPNRAGKEEENNKEKKDERNKKKKRSK